MSASDDTSKIDLSKIGAIILAIFMINAGFITMVQIISDSGSAAEYPAEYFVGYDLESEIWQGANLGKAYIENDMVSYQLRLDTSSKAWGDDYFDIKYNFYQGATNAIYIDGFDTSWDTGFQYSTGDLLVDGVEIPSSGWGTHIPTPEAGEAPGTGPTITNYMHSWEEVADSDASPNVYRYFRISGLPWQAIEDSGSDHVIIFFRAHLALSIIWQQDYESTLPEALSGNEFSGWTGTMHNGASYASGSSRHFYLESEGIGLKTVPIPITGYPTNVINGQKFVNGQPYDGWWINMEGWLYLWGECDNYTTIHYTPPAIMTAAGPWVSGYYAFTGLPRGNYSVWEDDKSGYTLVLIGAVPDLLDPYHNCGTGDIITPNPDESNVAHFGLERGTQVSPNAQKVDFYNVFGTPDIDIEKYVWNGTDWLDADEATGPFILEGDGWVDFKINVTNTGDVELSQITIDDDMYGEVAVLLTLAPDESYEQIYSMEWAPGQQVNNASVEGYFDLLEVWVTDFDLAHYFGAIPCIDIFKSVDYEMIVPGHVVTYTFNVTNCGNVPLSNVNVYDDLIDDTWYLGGDGILEPGEWWNFTKTFEVPEHSGELCNEATAYGDFGSMTVSSTDTACILVVNPCIDITKSVDYEMIIPGHTVTYTFNVTNCGDVDLMDVSVYDDVLDKTFYLGGDGILSPGEWWNFTDTYVVPVMSGELVNTATASGWVHDDHGEVTDTDTATVLVVNPCIDITKSVDYEMIIPGHTVTYTFNVTNCGDVDLMDVSVYDDVLDKTFYLGGDGILSPGEWWNFTDTYVVPVMSGELVNTATASGWVHDDHGEVTDTDTATVLVVNPCIDIEKSVWNGEEWVDADEATGPFMAQGDGTVKFLINVTNCGDIELHDITVWDSDLNDYVTLPFTSLAADASMEVEYSLAWAAGQQVNTATASGWLHEDHGEVTDADDANYYGTGKICVYKYEDLNLDGRYQEGEPAVAGVLIEIFDSQMCLIASGYTDADGMFCYDGLMLDTYHVQETLPSGWSTIDDTSKEVTIDEFNVHGRVNFLNAKNIDLSACKYQDVNGNGIIDEGDLPVENWRIDLFISDDGWELLESKWTGPCGCVLFEDLNPYYDYMISEEWMLGEESGWYPAPGWDTEVIFIHGVDFRSGDSFYGKGVVYGILRETGDVYEIDIPTGTSTLVFEMPTPPGANSASPNGLAYDAVNGYLYYTDYGLGTTPDTLYFWDGITQHEAGQIAQGTVACADFYDGRYYYIPSGTDDLRAISFNPDGTILEDVLIADISGNVHSWTFNGDIAVKDGIVYGWGLCGVSDHGYEFFTYDLGTTAFSFIKTAYQSSLQLAFGSDGTLYGHRSGELGEFYVIDISTAEVTMVIPTPDPANQYTDTASGVDTTHVNFLNIRYGKICVFKFEDLNGDGEWQCGERGVPGVTIEVWQNCELIRSGVTNCFGVVCFDRMLFGDYIVRENLAGSCMDCCWYNSTPARVDVTIDTDNTNVWVSFGNVRFGMICGHKYYDENNNGQFDPCTEHGIAGWEIWLYKDGEPWAMTHTDSNGVYCFCHLEFGDYTVVETVPEGWFATGPVEISVTIDHSGQRVCNVDFFNDDTGTICVFKYEDLNGDGEWQEGEPAVPGVTINLCKDGQLVATGVTDENGHVCFEDLKVGEYVVREMLTCCWYATSDNPQVVQLDGPYASVTFLNAKYGCICGYKFNDTNMNGIWDMCTEEGIEGWEIQLWQDGRMIAWTLTDRDGHYSFCGLRIGDYTVIEGAQEGWLPTSSTEIGVSIERSGQLVSDVNFLNFFADPCICVDKEVEGELYTFTSHTQGFWKNHPCEWVGILPGDMFPWVDSVMYPDGLTYMQVFNTPPAGDATLILAHQYIAAKLNDLKWGAPEGYAEFIADAEEFLAAHPIGSFPEGYDSDVAVHLSEILTSYNEGDFCCEVPMGLLTYTVTVTNCGHIDLYNVAVFDTLINQWFYLCDYGDYDGILAIGESWTFTYTYEIPGCYGHDCPYCGYDCGECCNWICNTAFAFGQWGPEDMNLWTCDKDSACFEVPTDDGCDCELECPCSEFDCDYLGCFYYLGRDMEAIVFNIRFGSDDIEYDADVSDAEVSEGPVFRTEVEPPREEVI